KMPQHENLRCRRQRNDGRDSARARRLDAGDQGEALRHHAAHRQIASGGSAQGLRPAQLAAVPVRPDPAVAPGLIQRLARIRSAPFSATMTTAALVLPATTRGNTDASIT